MTAETLAVEASQAVGHVYDLLGRVADEVLHSRPPRSALSESHFAGLQRLIADLLATESGVWGIGFVAAPFVVDNRERYMAWWQRHHERVSRLRLNFDPNSIDVYDYLQMDWYQLAQRGQQRVAYGPYVDYSGSEMYTITATIPVIAEGVFLGVAGADLVVGDIERRLIDVLRRCDDDAVVVNTEHRVIAANTARWFVGSRLPAAPRTDEMSSAFSAFGDVAELPLGTGWTLAITRP